MPKVQMDKNKKGQEPDKPKDPNAPSKHQPSKDRARIDMSPEAIRKRDLEGNSTPEPGPNEIVGKLHLMVDLESRHIGIAEMKAGSVGHTWVSLEYNQPDRVPSVTPAKHRTALRNGGKYADSMGFWPDTEGLHTANGEGVGYSTKYFKSWVQGHMRNPDEAHQGMEKATMSYPVTYSQMLQAIQYGESKAAAQYSVYSYNCTTFARGMVKAAGHSAPSMATAGICLPDKAYDMILGYAKKGKEGAEVMGGVGNNEAYVNAGDIGVTWKQRAIPGSLLEFMQKPNVLEVASVRPGSKAAGKLKVGDCVAFIDGQRCNSEATFRKATFGAYGKSVDFSVIDMDKLTELGQKVESGDIDIKSLLKKSAWNKKINELCDDLEIEIDKAPDKPKSSKKKGGRKGTEATL